MEVVVNYGAVVLAALSAMVVGSIWYMPSVLGNTWMKLAGIKPDKNFPKKDMAQLYIGALVTSLLTAYILAHVSFLSNSFYGNSFLQDTLSTAFWLWLGIMACRLWVHDSFEGRPRKLTLLNGANDLVTIIVMALIIGAMGL